MRIWSDWFGVKSASAEAVAHLPPWLQQIDRDAGYACSYEARLREVYRTNPVGLRAVRLVAGAVGGLTIFSDQADARALVAAPGLMEGIAASLLLHGNAYCRLVVDGDGQPAAITTMRPEQVTIRLDPMGHVAAYELNNGAGTVRIAARDPLVRRLVAHIKTLNPEDDLYGLGCLEAATPAASIHNRASRWNKALLDNAARPSGALSYEPSDGAHLSAAQYDMLRRQIADHFSGSANAGRPLLLDGGMKWLPMALTPADMDFVALKEAAARDIALAFGVPPVLVGLPGDSTYANAREAGRALMRHTVLPMANRILAELGDVLGDWMNKPVELRVDIDRITELADDRATLWSQVADADFLTRAEKRHQLGFDLEGKE